MTLTKAELADLLFEKVGLNKREAKDMVEAFFEEIRGALERGESVKLSGFGDPDQRPPRRHLPCQPEAEGHGRESAPWSQAAGKLSSRRFPPSATSPSVR
jgi:hypothetical protein